MAGQTHAGGCDRTCSMGEGRAGRAVLTYGLKQCFLSAPVAGVKEKMKAEKV